MATLCPPTRKVPGPGALPGAVVRSVRSTPSAASRLVRTFQGRRSRPAASSARDSMPSVSPSSSRRAGGVGHCGDGVAGVLLDEACADGRSVISKEEWAASADEQDGRRAAPSGLVHGEGVGLAGDALSLGGTNSASGRDRRPLEPSERVKARTSKDAADRSAARHRASSSKKSGRRHGAVYGGAAAAHMPTGRDSVWPPRRAPSSPDRHPLER